MKVVFLHGIGNGDPDCGWLEGLNRGLLQAGYPAIRREQTIAPKYSGILKTDGIKSKLPPVTYRVKDDADSRRDFERRQARVQRRLKNDFGVSAFGFHRIPDSVRRPAEGFLIDRGWFADLDQVRQYVRSDDTRAAVMNQILDHLPSSGDVIIVGHSLGSVIAIDLLDHLPDDLHVRRFITVGSPANIEALHEGSERLLKRFPYARVDDWSNLLNVMDPVTGGRGLASTFPGAQDFVIDCKGHPAGTYLGHPAVAELVAEVLYPTKEIVPASSDIAVRLSDNEALLILLLTFASAVARNITDERCRHRYRDALQVVTDDACAQVTSEMDSGRSLPLELQTLLTGSLPDLPHRWEPHEAVHELTVLALTNLASPYEIDVQNAPRNALPEMAVTLGFTRSFGEKIGESITEVQQVLARKGGVPWGRVLTAAAGVALVAAGPIGLAIAAPAGVFGGAALVGGLAALGPGGMVGGLATLGGLAGAGAAVTTGAATAGGAADGPTPDLSHLIVRIAVEYARKQLDLPYDEGLWYQLSAFESKISAEDNRLSAFSDPKSPTIANLRAGKVAVQSLMRFMIEKGLSPRALTEGEWIDDAKELAPADTS